MNTKMKVRAVVFVIFFLLLAAAIVYIMTSTADREIVPYSPEFSIREQNQPEEGTWQAATSDAIPSSPAPAPAAEGASPSASASQPADSSIVNSPLPIVNSPAPTPTPYVPTPTPYVPTPEPAGLPLGSGTISSGMPWLLNIHADWSAVTATNSRAEVTVVVYADHYSLHYNSFENLAIRLGDESHRLYANEIQSDLNQPQSTELGRYTYSIPLAKGETVSLPLSAVWEFGGTYGDGYGHTVDIPSIRCEGTVMLSR